MVISFGKGVIHSLEVVGEFTLFIAELGKKTVTTRHFFDRAVTHIYELGVRSVLMVMVTVFFVVLAFSVQVSSEFIKFGAGDLLGKVVAMATWRELSPLITAVILAGRVGAAISAELGAMKVSEQIDAIRSLSQDPMCYLIVPRVWACTFITPLLVALGDVVGVLSGALVAYTSGKINLYTYFDSIQSLLITDITGGIAKGAVFGAIIALFSCFIGIQASAGAKGVGSATTKAVVSSLLGIFIVNYFLSLVLY